MAVRSGGMNIYGEADDRAMGDTLVTVRYKNSNNAIAVY
jgi:hypothetical protein